MAMGVNYPKISYYLAMGNYFRMIKSHKHLYCDCPLFPGSAHSSPYWWWENISEEHGEA